MEYEIERRDVAYWIRRVYRQRLTTASGGNISRRVDGERFVITPGSIDKARVRADQVVIMSMDGCNLTPALKASSEGRMHLEIYRRFPQVQAIIHAHPTTACAFTCAQTPIEPGLLCETYALLDPPVLAPYAMSSTQQLADAAAEGAARSSCILLQNHGVLTTGVDLMQAFHRLELLEEAARVTLITRQLRGVRHLNDEERADLDQLVGRACR